MKNSSSCFFMCQPPLPCVLRTSPLPSGNAGYCSCCHTPVFTPPVPHLRHCRPLSNRESGKATCLIPKRIKKKNILTRTSCCPGRHINYGPDSGHRSSSVVRIFLPFPIRPGLWFSSCSECGGNPGTFFKLGFGNSMCMKFREY